MPKKRENAYSFYLNAIASLGVTFSLTHSVTLFQSFNLSTILATTHQHNINNDTTITNHNTTSNNTRANNTNINKTNIINTNNSVFIKYEVFKNAYTKIVQIDYNNIRL